MGRKKASHVKGSRAKKRARRSVLEQRRAALHDAHSGPEEAATSDYTQLSRQFRATEVTVFCTMPGFFMFSDSIRLQGDGQQNLVEALEIIVPEQSKPRLQRLLLITFRTCFEERHLYDVEGDATLPFWEHVLGKLKSRTIAVQRDIGPVMEIKDLKGVRWTSFNKMEIYTLIRLVKFYIEARQKFIKQSIPKECLVLKKRSARQDACYGKTARDLLIGPLFAIIPKNHFY